MNNLKIPSQEALPEVLDFQHNENVRNAKFTAFLSYKKV